MKNGKVKPSRTSSGKVFGCGVAEPYGDRARRREGFEPHDLRVIASRPSSSRVVLRVRQAALPKLALWKTPLAKTPCPWRFDFANPTSHARRSHNPKALCQNFNLQIKKTRDTLRCLLFFWLRRWDLNHMTFGLSLRARLRRVSFCACGKPLFQNSRFGRHRLPKRHAHGVLTSLTQRATLVVLITRKHYVKISICR